VRSEQFEHLFESWKIPFELVAEFKLEQIVFDDDAQVRAGDHRARGERIGEYATHMTAGAQFPPIVVMRPDRLIDGNTRYRAAEKVGRVTLPAYVLDLPSLAMSRMIGAALNQLGGDRLHTDDIKKAALDFIDQGFADAAIALHVGRKAEQIRQWRRRDSFDQRAKSLGLGEKAERLTNVERIRLDTIEHEPVFAKAVELATEMRLDKEGWGRLTTAVKEASSDDAAVAAIFGLRGELAPIAVGPIPVDIARVRKVRDARRAVTAIVDLADHPDYLYVADGAAAELDKWRTVQRIASWLVVKYEEQPKP